MEITTQTGTPRFSPHTFIDEGVFEDATGGRGMEFGSKVHEFAEASVLGEQVTPDGPDETNVQSLLDSLDGDLHAEKQAFLPLDVDGERVTISGVIDLLHVTPERAEIIDYKTDLDRRAESEYQKQLSVYYHVVAELYPDREVTMAIFYTSDGERKPIKPLSKTELRELVRGVRNE